MATSVALQPVGLLELPDELLCEIFNDVYAHWEGEEEIYFWSRRPRRPTVPFCRRLKGIQLEALYRKVEIRVRWNLDSFDKFFETIKTSPQLANLVSSFSLSVTDTKLNGQPRVTFESIRNCFNLFRNLESLSFTDNAVKKFPELLTVLPPSILPPKCTSIRLDIHPGFSTALHALPSQLQTLAVSFLKFGSGQSVLRDPTSPLLALPDISRLTLCHPGAQYQAAVELVGRCSHVQSLHLHEMSSTFEVSTITAALPAATEVTSFSLLASYDSSERRRRSIYSRNNVFVDSQLSKFPNLKTLRLGGATSSQSTSFFDEIHKLPLESLILERGEHIPLSSLVALVSSTTRHLTLRNLTLNFLDENGKIGTRVANVSFPFETVGFEFEDVEEDLMVDDWTHPQFPPGVSSKGLLALQETGRVNGVVVDGKAFEAIKIEQAYDEDVELLNELWAEWKEWKLEEDRRRKGNGTGSKGKKGTKSKK